MQAPPTRRKTRPSPRAWNGARPRRVWERGRTREEASTRIAVAPPAGPHRPAGTRKNGLSAVSSPWIGRGRSLRSLPGPSQQAADRGCRLLKGRKSRFLEKKHSQVKGQVPASRVHESKRFGAPKRPDIDGQRGPACDSLRSFFLGPSRRARSFPRISSQQGPIPGSSPRFLDRSLQPSAPEPKDPDQKQRLGQTPWHRRWKGLCSASGWRSTGSLPWIGKPPRGPHGRSPPRHPLSAENCPTFGCEV